MSWDFLTKLIRVQSLAAAELNHILHAHVVDGALSTFGCMEWESDLCRGVMCARCYPFDMPKHRFHGMNPMVMYIHYTNMYIPCIYMIYTMFINACT